MWGTSFLARICCCGFFCDSLNALCDPERESVLAAVLHRFRRSVRAPPCVHVCVRVSSFGIIFSRKGRVYLPRSPQHLTGDAPAASCLYVGHPKRVLP
uniref:Putative secreted protein n=1 Tax=Anopheles marajoara TaxID=58244 RepID=A0A2M4C9B0_9DIPT